MSSRGHLTRRLYTDSHIRIVPIHFNATPGSTAKANKIYEYHLTAFATAYIQSIDPDYFESKLGYKVPNLLKLQQVTKGKTPESLVLRHLCGNIWCTNPFHIELGSKTENDEEEHCHYFLRKTNSLKQFTAFQDDWCTLFHAKAGQPCWTNVYQEELLRASRLSLSQVPQE